MIGPVPFLSGSILKASDLQAAVEELETADSVLDERVDDLELGLPGSEINTSGTPGNVDLTATPNVRAGKSTILSPNTSFVITHPRFTADARLTATLQNSTARIFSFNASAGQVTVLTTTYTALVIEWCIIRYGDEG